jgi:expansin (peptidoglycan-binding protein)
MGRAKHDDILTIAASGDTTGALNVASRALGTIQIPAAMTGATLNIEGQSGVSETWVAVRDSAGTQLSVPATVSSIFRIPDGAFGCNVIRFVSSGTEAAARTLYVQLVS